MNIAIYGYGNLGRGVESALAAAPDCRPVGIFTRRPPHTLNSLTDIPIYSASELESFERKIDVLIVCGGSATDLPSLSPALARNFCIVDSFDTHADIPRHFENVDAAARKGDTLCLISAGWDPGLFSVARTLFSAILPSGDDFTFWGRGVSQGHSDAIRRIKGVTDARQYTLPLESALAAAEQGIFPSSAKRGHRRECYVVAEEGADLESIRQEIVTMPNYFSGYKTDVTFITAEQMKAEHSSLPHGGRVIRRGGSGVGGEHFNTALFSLSMGSNPEFTGGVLLAYARALYRMLRRGRRGCLTVLDIAPADLSPLSPEELRRIML